ncbi:MAG: hypothetical protein BGO76_03965 [Caedibacter sp. 38-128]|nr:hypothetical protein [Holosporales bacterium]OJX08011.1 MAG: hypothetical protein BGO76_03965 [Caedibacter sp. 38-128]
MMKTHNKKTNGKKNQWTQACLGKSTIMRKLRREAGGVETSQGDKRVREWQQIFNRWWDLIFDEGGRIFSCVIPA